MQEKQETWIPSLGWEDALEKAMATHSGTPAWRIPWTEEPGGLQSTGSQWVRHDWAHNLITNDIHYGLLHKVIVRLKGCMWKGSVNINTKAPEQYQQWLWKMHLVCCPIKSKAFFVSGENLVSKSQSQGEKDDQKENIPVWEQWRLSAKWLWLHQPWGTT